MATNLPVYISQDDSFGTRRGNVSVFIIMTVRMSNRIILYIFLILVLYPSVDQCYLSSSCSIGIFRCNKCYCSCFCRSRSCNIHAAGMRSNLYYRTNGWHLDRSSVHSCLDDPVDGNILPHRCAEGRRVVQPPVSCLACNNQRGTAPRHWIWEENF